MGITKKTVFKSALDFDHRQLAICIEIMAEQKAMLAIVKTALPDEIAEHAKHCVKSGTRLLVYTETACWGSQIRFFHSDILNKISTYGYQNIASLQVKIQPQLESQQMRIKPQLASTTKIGESYKQFDENDNKEVLNQALSRLEKTLDKRLKAKR